MNALYFWLLLGYDYLGNLWYGIIALNNNFYIKVCDFFEITFWLACKPVLIRVTLNLWQSISLLSSGITGIDQKAWPYLDNLECPVQIFILCNYLS